MIEKKKWDIIVIGGGPAGLSAAVSAYDKGANVCIIEREERAGGILKQCIHDGFGVIRFKEKLTGPEYAYRYIEMIRERNIPLYLNTFLTKISMDKSDKNNSYTLSLVNGTMGAIQFEAPSLIIATGCRERTARQIFIHGDRPAGILTAGLAQYFINIQGYMPAKKCVILGSGDIGLIMARRLTLEGAEVEGVYEIKSEVSGLTRNVVQCLEDYNIPLHLSTTVTEVHGKNRVEGVTVAQVDEKFNKIKDTERYIDCDALILSVGLIPENDILYPLNITQSKVTKGPLVDQNLMTMQEGIFSCGNALHVNDLVDYVSESGDIAGNSSIDYLKHNNRRKLIPITTEDNILYTVPQYIDMNSNNDAIIYFRSSSTIKNVRLSIYTDNNEELISKKFIAVKPPEMERVKLKIENIPENTKEIQIKLMEDKK